MSLRRAAGIRFSLLRSLFGSEALEAAACGSPHLSSRPAAANPLLSLRNFAAAPQGSASFVSSSTPAAADAAPEPSSSSTTAASLFPDVLAHLDQRASEPYVVQPRRVFAVVEVGGTQYKVTPDDVIVTEKLEGVDVSDVVRLQRVLMLGSAAETVIGRPYVPDASVTAAVEEQFLDGKVIIFKKRRRKNSRRTNGHRQPLTTLRILSVEGIEEAAVPDGN